MDLHRLRASSKALWSFLTFLLAWVLNGLGLLRVGVKSSRSRPSPLNFLVVHELSSGQAGKK